MKITRNAKTYFYSFVMNMISILTIVIHFMHKPLREGLKQETKQLSGVNPSLLITNLVNGLIKCEHLIEKAINFVLKPEACRMILCDCVFLFSSADGIECRHSELYSKFSREIFSLKQNYRMVIDKPRE